MTMPDNIDDFTYATVYMSEMAKKAICEAHGGPADSPPIMLWHGVGNEHLEVIALPMPSSDGGSESAPAILDAALRHAFVEFGKPQFVAFISEAFMATEVDPDEAKNVKRGDLQRRFEQQGPTDDIVEIISIVTFAPPKNQVRHVVISVKYDDKGMPEFDKFGETSQLVSGAIADVVSEFISFVNVE
jgi:hypothetical protein